MRAELEDRKANVAYFEDEGAPVKEHEGDAELAELEPSRYVYEPPKFLSDTASGNTDASGNLALTLYRCPVGYRLDVSRVVLEDSTHTPASPFSAASAWIGVHVEAANTARAILAATTGSLVDFGPLTAGGPCVPALFEYNSASAPGVRENRALLVTVNGGPASTMVVARFQGTLVKL